MGLEEIIPAESITFVEYEVPTGMRHIRIPFMFHRGLMPCKIPLDPKEERIEIAAKVLMQRDKEIQQLLKICQDSWKDLMELRNANARFMKFYYEMVKYFGDNKVNMEIIKSVRKRIEEEK